MKTRTYWYVVLTVICSFNLNLVNAFERPFLQKAVESEDWQGKWFPQSPNKTEDDNPVVELMNLHDPKHGIKMGVKSPYCDDGKINITLDWDNSPINYTCYQDKHAFLPKLDVHPIIHSDVIPKAYHAPHKCMNVPIFYDEATPTYGTHRPLWPMYGEYLFVPRQRWIHSLEHGAIVMLYHPCANNQEVNLLKKLVTGCLFKHIITPHNSLPPERPLAVVAWGVRLEMSKVVPKIIVEFIRNHALHGPEQTSEDGQFDFALIEHAKLVSDQDDNKLCPNYE